LGSPICSKKSTARKLGKVGNLGNVTRFPRVFRCFSLESNIANDCQLGNVTPAGLTHWRAEWQRTVVGSQLSVERGEGLAGREPRELVVGSPIVPRHENLAMLAMLAMLLVFPVFSAVFCSKVTLPTIASLAMLLRVFSD
jgi:hypothetical protein